jgi:hypothetical protein
MIFSWVRPCFRVLGVFFIGLSLPSVFNAIGQCVAYFAPLHEPWQFVLALGWIVGAFSQAGLGIYLLVKGERLIAWVLRDVHQTCARCGYDLRKTPGGPCPECGLDSSNPARASGAATQSP